MSDQRQRQELKRKLAKKQKRRAVARVMRERAVFMGRLRKDECARLELYRRVEEAHGDASDGT